MLLPALLYTLVNVLSYYAVGFLGSTTFQLLSNFKVVSTAVVFRLFVRERFNVVRWICIISLTLGLFIGAPRSGNDEHQVPHLVKGACIVIVICFASAFAGVYFQVQLKNVKFDAVLQNVYLYCWTCLFSFLSLYLEWSQLGSRADTRVYGFYRTL